MKARAPKNQKEVLEELKRLYLDSIELEEGPKKEALLKKIKKSIRDCIGSVKEYLEMRPNLSKADRDYLDNWTGWFEYQDN